MKIIYITNQRIPTEKAYGVQIVSVCRAFSRIGVQVELVMPTRRGEQGDNLTTYYGPLNFSLTRIRTPEFYPGGHLERPAFWLRQGISAIRLVQWGIRERDRVIYTRDVGIAVLTALLGRTTVFEAHSFSPRRTIAYTLLRLLGVRLVSITRHLAQRFQGLGFQEDDILVAPDGVDLEPFDAAPTRSVARETLHLPSGVPIIGYVGQLRTRAEEKGVKELIQAFANVLKAFPDAVLLIVGGAPEDIEYHRTVSEKLGLSNQQVRFTGSQPHEKIPAHLRAMSVAVMPFPFTEHYAYFMSPMKMFEYMASGTPIVASDLPSVREVLNDKLAVFVEPGDPGSLTAGIKSILRLSEQAERMAGSARREVERYSWAQRAACIRDFILTQHAEH